VSALAFIDEHTVRVAAPPAAVWAALGQTLGRYSGRPVRIITTLLGTDPRLSTGDPLTTGATIPGFRVREAIPDQRLVLAGRHHFAEYELVFTLAAAGSGTRLGALSYSDFPGLHGRLYRAVVVGSRGHRVAVRRLLLLIARTADR
jgi:hypothetical protein